MSEHQQELCELVIEEMVEISKKYSVFEDTYPIFYKDFFRRYVVRCLLMSKNMELRCIKKLRLLGFNILAAHQ